MTLNRPLQIQRQRQIQRQLRPPKKSRRPLQIQRQRPIQRQLRPPKKSRRPLQVQRQRQIQGQLRPPKKKQAAATNSKTTAPRYGLPLLGWKYSGAVAAGTACRAPTDARGCGERHPPRLPRPASFTCPENCGPKNRLDWIAVGVNEVDFAEVQLPDAWLDFRAVTDHDPYEIVGKENLLCRGIEVPGGQRADFSRHGVVIIVGPSGIQYGGDGAADGVQRLARPRQTKRFVGLGVRQFLRRYG